MSLAMVGELRSAGSRERGGWPRVRCGWQGLAFVAAAGVAAAGMPCAGNPSRASADSLALMPVYTVMGTADNIMSIPAVEAFLAQLDSLGATYRYDVEQGWTHQQTCIESYTTPRLAWLLSQQSN